MASILFEVVRICNSQFKCNYLKEKKHFFHFLFHFLNLHHILNILKKTCLSQLMYFGNYRQWKSRLDHPLKSVVSENALKKNMPTLSQKLVKSPSERFKHHFPSLSGKLIWKMSPLVSGEILAVLLTHWLPMASILFKVVRICNSQFKCNYLKNKKVFLNFLFHFCNLHQFLRVLKKRMIVIANAFLKLQTVKNLVEPLSKKRCFTTRFDTQQDQATQILAICPWDNFYHVFSSFLEKLIWKMSPLVLGEILGVFVNTLTADGKYPVQGCENLQLPIQMQLFQKWKTFFQFFILFLRSTWNFEHFERKNDRHS